jgi:hypothetical protein
MVNDLNEQVYDLMGVAEKQPVIPQESVDLFEDEIDEVDEIKTEEPTIQEEPSLPQDVLLQDMSAVEQIDDDDTIVGEDSSDVLFGGVGSDLKFITEETDKPEELKKVRTLPKTTLPSGVEVDYEMPTAFELGVRGAEFVGGVGKRLFYNTKDIINSAIAAPSKVAFGLYTLGGMSIDYSPALLEGARVATGNGLKHVINFLFKDEDEKDEDNVIANYLLNTLFNQPDVENYDQFDADMEEGKHRVITGAPEGYGQNYFNKNILGLYQIENPNVITRTVGLGVEFFTPLRAVNLAQFGITKFANLDGEDLYKAINKTMDKISKEQKRLENQLKLFSKEKKGNVTSRKLRGSLKELQDLKRYVSIGYNPRLFRKEYMQFGSEVASTKPLMQYVQNLRSKHIVGLNAPLKKMNLTEGVVESVKPQIDMAVAMAIGSTTAEEVYKSFGFSEKDAQIYGMFTALPFGIFGVSSGLGVVPVAGAIGLQYSKLKYGLENYYHRFVSKDDVAANVAKLRSIGKTTEEIDQIFKRDKKTGDYVYDDDGRKIIIPERLAKLGAQTPEAEAANFALSKALNAMPEGPMKKKIHANIAYMIDPETGLAANFAKRFRKDVDDGIIPAKILDETGGELPLLLENIAPLVAIRALRETLSKKVSIGVHKSIDSLNLLSQLDNLNNALSTQSKLLNVALEAEIKKIMKLAPDIEGTESHVFLKSMREKVDLLDDDANDVAGMVKQAFTAINQKAEIDNVNSSIDGSFGKDIINENVIKAQLKKEGIDINNVPSTQPVADLREQNVPANIIKRTMKNRLDEFGSEQENIVKNNMNRLQTEIDKRYKNANASSVIVEVNDLLEKSSKMIEEISVEARAIGVSGTRSTAIGIVEDARRQGLTNYVTNLRNNNIDEDQIVAQLLLFKTTIEDKIIPKAIPNFRKFDENSLYKDVDGELVLDPESVNRLVTHISKAPAIPEIARDIPSHLNLEQLKNLRSAAYTKANASSNSSVRSMLAQEAAGIDSQINKLEEQLIKAGSNLAAQYDKNVIEKLRIANEYYKNTGAKVFKKRAGRLLKENYVNLYNNALRTPFEGKDAIFEVAFIKHTNYQENSKIFDILFSQLDDKGNVIPDTLNLEATKLLKQSIRRWFSKNVNSTTGSGITQLPEGFVNNFLLKNDMFSTQELKHFDNHINLRKAEEASGKPFPLLAGGEAGTKKADEILSDHIKTLTTERENIFKKSLLFQFNDMKDFKTNENFFKSVFETESALKNGRATEQYFQDRLLKAGGVDADGIAKTEEGRIIQQNIKRYNDAVEHIRSNEVAPAVNSLIDSGVIRSADEAISRMGPRIIAGAENPKSPVAIILDSVRGTDKEEAVTKSLQVVFGRYLLNKAFVLTDNVSMQSGFGTMFGSKTMELGSRMLGLQKEIDIKTFSKILDDNHDTLKLLFGENSTHLKNIEEVFQLSVATSGKTGLRGIIGSFGSGISTGQIQSRLWGVIRNVVSPRYVAGEFTLQLMQMKKAEFLMKALTEPEVTNIIIKGMNTKGKLSPKYIAEWKRIMASATLGSQNENVSWNVGRLQMYNDELLAAKLKAVYNVGAETLNVLNIFGDFPPSLEQTPAGVKKVDTGTSITIDDNTTPNNRYTPTTQPFKINSNVQNNDVRITLD